MIHVAGTNGKGSTIAFLRAMLEAARQARPRLHLAASRALQRAHSPRRAGRRRAGRATTSSSAALAECERANGEHADHPVRDHHRGGASAVFAACRPTVLLLEVGLGGRLDATNVIEHPLATVITPISIDHVEFLGDTLEKIAAEKAGILKRGAPAIVAAQPRDALAVIERRAAQARRAAEDRRRGLDRDGRARPPRLSGRGGLARPAGAAALRPPPVRQCRAGDRRIACDPTLKLAAAAFETGLTKVEWPARLQRLAQGRLVDARPRRAANCGSTAATIRMAAASSPRRWPISRSACRGRWC